MRTAAGVLVAAVLLSACPRPTIGTTGRGEGLPEARSGIVDAEVGNLFEEHWAWAMATSPEWATSLGEHRFDDLLSDRSAAAAADADVRRAAFLARAQALSGGTLDGRDALFLGMFADQLRDELATSACRSERWSFSPRMNPVVDLFDALELQPTDTAPARDRMIRRVAAFPRSIRDHLDALRTGLAEGLVVNRTSAERTLSQVRTVLDDDVASWSIAKLGPDDDAWRTAWTAAIARDVRPALVAYVAFLTDEVLPVARDDTRPGLAGLPDMGRCYTALARKHVTRDVDPTEVHEVGLREMAKIHAEIAVVGGRVFGTTDVPTILARLRDDPTLRFGSEAEIVAAAEGALAAANAAVPRVFGRLPATPCVVSVIPDYEAPFTTIAYYQPPTAAESTLRGQYFVNTYQPATRTRFEAQALAFHESVPGHHLQIALAYELPAVPAFHRYAGATAFVEGWGLYSERLADELGLYSTDLDRLGMLSFDAWRAGRLVVDTGVHALGWSRADAEAYLLANTALAPANVSNEVDRYITWPGQALAYKLGQIELLALRDDAKQRLGPAWDPRVFHDVVLGEGALPLDRLRERVARWLSTTTP